MDLIAAFFDLILHLDRHLAALVAEYGVWVYAILFLIVFCETGLVVTPFLPGDSLLFVAGTLAATGAIEVHYLALLLAAAAILGDAANYAIGRYAGPRIFRSESSAWLNRRHLQRAHAFYARHGGMTVVIARFIPIIRTYAPFVAGMGSMSYRRFAAYNVAGALLWVALLVYGGYFFGNISIVRQNLALVIIGIVILSILPPVVEYVRHRQRPARNQPAPPG